MSGTCVCEQAARIQGLRHGVVCQRAHCTPLEASTPPRLDGNLKAAADHLLMKTFPAVEILSVAACEIRQRRAARQAFSPSRAQCCRQSIGKNLIFEIGRKEPFEKGSSQTPTLPPKTFDWWEAARREFRCFLDP